MITVMIITTIRLGIFDTGDHCGRTVLVAMKLFGMFPLGMMGKVDRGRHAIPGVASH
jgi:hypothetical protein